MVVLKKTSKKRTEKVPHWLNYSNFHFGAHKVDEDGEDTESDEDDENFHFRIRTSVHA